MKAKMMATGGMSKKGYAMGGAAMPMMGDKPAFIGDGKGAMAKGGAVKKMMYGGDMAKTMMAKGGSVAKKAKK